MSAAAKKDINFEVIKDTYIGVLKKYLVIEGRARRREFWLFFLCNLVLGIIPFIGWLIGLATFIPSITVGVRRLHDTNRNGLWELLSLVPLLGLIFLFAGIFAAANYGSLRFLLILVFLVSIAPAIILLVWAAQEGTNGSNKYGPDPKAGSHFKAVPKPKAVSKPKTVKAPKPKAVSKPKTVKAPKPKASSKPKTVKTPKPKASSKPKTVKTPKPKSESPKAKAQRPKPKKK